MARRIKEKQSEHDSAVYAAQDIYQKKNKSVWVNPNGEKNKSWAGTYIDVIAAEKPDADRAWVIEVETEDSVSKSEAEEQWKDYSEALENWYLAVPENSVDKAQKLLQNEEIKNCNVIKWRKNSDGTFTYWNLPGLD